MSKGLLIVVSGPAGVGKGTVCKCVKEMLGEDILISVSATTRKPRTGEIDGQSYFFKSESEFKSMIEREELLEWAYFCGNYYGTPKNAVLDLLSAGKDVILEIETDGAKQVKKHFPEGVFIFILPPTFDELVRRITERATEPPDIIEKRMAVARNELNIAEEYEYNVVNDMVENAAKNIISIISNEKLKKLNKCKM